MTKAEIKTLTAFYTTRIESIDSALKSDMKPPLTDTHLAALCDMLGEYTNKLYSLRDTKEYMVNFEGGGWNTTHATNDEDALAKAKAKFEGQDPDKFFHPLVVKSVSIASSEGIDAAMRSFY